MTLSENIGQNTHSRHQIIWGEEGQKTLEDAVLLILGSDKLAIDVSMSAAMLGVGTIYIMGEKKQDNAMFLDMHFDYSTTLATQLPPMLEKLMQPVKMKKKYLGIPLKPTLRNLRNFKKNVKKIDGIISTTNNTAEQTEIIRFIEENETLYYLAGVCSETEIKIYGINPKLEKPKTLEVEGKQSFLTTGIISGVLVEEFRKQLFYKNKDVFRKLKYDKQLGQINILQPERNTSSYFEKVISEGKMTLDKEITLNFIREGKKPWEGNFRNKKILLVGAGALGNFYSIIMSKLKIARLDVVDFDIVEPHNIVRQPLLYDAIGKYKSDALSEKINKIHGRKISKSYRARVVHGKTQLREFGHDWFEQNKYDLIIGATDNYGARSALNEIAYKQKMIFIDGGTSPGGGRLITYYPNKTPCLSNFIDLARLVQEEQRTNQTRSCAFFEASVNMTNQIVGNLMAIETLHALNNRPFSGKITYSSFGKRFDYYKVKNETDCKF